MLSTFREELDGFSYESSNGEGGELSGVLLNGGVFGGVQDSISYSGHGELSLDSLGDEYALGH